MAKVTAEPAASSFKFSPAKPPHTTDALKAAKSAKPSAPTRAAAPAPAAAARRAAPVVMGLTGFAAAPAPQANAAANAAMNPPQGTPLAGAMNFAATAAVGAAAAPAGDPRKVNVLTSRAEFNARSSAGEGAGAAGMSEVKFLYDRQEGKTYFLPKEYQYHYFFARDVLGVRDSLEEFNRKAYRDPARRFVPGTITAYDNYVGDAGKKGVYGISFWSTDVVHAPLITDTFGAITRALPFAKGALVYHPGGQTQENLLTEKNGADAKALAKAKVPVLSNTELAKGYDFTALNPGVSFGELKVVHGTGDGGEVTRRHVAIYADDVPPTLPPTAGVLTPKPQTYLSHDALKARQDHTPYAYARDVLNDPKVQQLEGKLVRLEITPNGYSLRQATKAEADAYLESLRPDHDQTLHSNLTPKTPKSIDAIKFGEASTYGSKSVNVGVLHRLLQSGALNRGRQADEPEVSTPEGWGIPASFYADFMKTAKYDATQTFAQRLDAMLKDPNFKDPKKRAAMLTDMQQHVEDAEMPKTLHTKLEKLKADFHAKLPNENMRLRSSSNSEDLEGFNGAGLFESYTYRFDDTRPSRSLDKRLQRVFASVFNERAMAEFDFYRVDPKSVNMAELVMPNEDGEVANGVVRWGGAIPGWDTMTLNAQVGENLVTNPQAGATPDSIVVGNYGFNGEAEIQYEQRTNQPLPPGRTAVLKDGEIRALFRAMKVIQSEFKKLYHKENDPNFAIECEFKITSDGKLSIKQARPWVG